MPPPESAAQCQLPVRGQTDAGGDLLKELVELGFRRRRHAPELKPVIEPDIDVVQHQQVEMDVQIQRAAIARDRAYLGGFVTALVESPALDAGFAKLVIYVYLLQDGLSVDAARLSRFLLRLPPAGELQKAFVRGRGDAEACLQSPPVALKTC